MKNIFEIAPDALNLYPFKDVPNLYNSQELKRHFRNLLDYFMQAIESLKDPEVNIVTTLKKLGKRHVGYEVVEEHYNVVGRAILDTL